jgi:hypothetical protein
VRLAAVNKSFITSPPFVMNFARCISVMSYSGSGAFTP